MGKNRLPILAGDAGSILGSGRSPGGGNGTRLQDSCWEIPWTEELGDTAGHPAQGIISLNDADEGDEVQRGEHFQGHRPSM